MNDYKNEFQKFLIRVYKKNNGQFVYMLFDENGGNDSFIDLFIGKNRNILYRKCEKLKDSISKHNRDYNGYVYASNVLSMENNF